MLNALLLEVECKKKAPKGPDPGGPEMPTAVGAVQLGRVVAAVIGYRKKLAAASKDYADKTKKLALAKTAAKKAKADHDVACAKLRVAANENWLKFGIARWKLFADWAQANGVQNNSLKNALAYGAQEVGYAGQHLSVLGTSKPVPPIGDLEYDYGSYGFKKGGKPFSFDTGVAPVSAAPAPEPEAEPAPTKQAKKTAAEPEPAPAVTEPTPAAGPALAKLPPPLSNKEMADSVPKADEIVDKLFQPDKDLAHQPLIAMVKAMKDRLEKDLGHPVLLTLTKKLIDDALAKKVAALAPDKPAKIGKLTPEQKKELGVYAKNLQTDALLAGSEKAIQFDDIKKGMFGDADTSDEVTVDIFNAADDAKALTKLADLDMPQAQSLADDVAKDLAEKNSIHTPEFAKVISVEIGKKLGKWVPYGTLADITKDAVAKVGKNWNALTNAEKEDGLKEVRKQYREEAQNSDFWPPPMPGTTMVKEAFAKVGVNLSTKGVTVASQLGLGSMTLVHHWSWLSGDTQAKLIDATVKNLKDSKFADLDDKDAAKAAVVSDGDPYVLSPDAIINLLALAQEKVKKKPEDLLGFLAAIKKGLETVTSPSAAVWSNIASDEIFASTGQHLGGLASDYGIDHWSNYLTQVVDTVNQVKIKKFDAAGFRAACFAAWDKAAAFQKPTWTMFGTGLIFDDNEFDKAFNLSNAAAEAAGASDKVGYLLALFNEWFTEWTSKPGKTPAPVVTTPTPDAAPVAALPPPALPPGFNYDYSKFKKISKPDHLNNAQLIYLAQKCAEAIKTGDYLTAKGEIGAKKVAGVAAKIHEEFKNDWASAGVTDFGKDLAKAFLDNAIKVVHDNGAAVGTESFYATLLDKYGKSYVAANAGLGKNQPSPAVAAPTPSAPAASGLQDIPALINTLIAQNPASLTDWEKTNLLDIWQKTVGAGHVYGSTVPSWKFTKHQHDVLQLFLNKAKSLIAAGPSVPPVVPTPVIAGVTLEVGPTASAASYQAAGLKPADNPLGMTFEEVAAFSSLKKPGKSPEKPADSLLWKNKNQFFGGGSSGGGHEKWAIGLDEKGEVTKGTFKAGTASGAWMFKGMAPCFAAGEVASNRVQALLGFANTPDVWTTDLKGEHGVVQKFQQEPNFRSKGTENEPWVEGDAAVKQLQHYLVLNYIASEHDDHGGNYSILPDGRLKGVDRGQAMKFFDSSHSILDYVNWEPPNGAAQNDSKGLPVKVMRRWAAGETVPLMSLSDPSFEAMISRAEAIPSDVYKKMWRPYAEGAAHTPYPSHNSGKNALGEWSSVAADKTVEGFLEGVNNRRKNVRASIGAMYAALAKTRAQSLKTKGDARPLAEIESEIRDQMGIDKFLANTNAAKEVAPVIVANPAPPPTSDEAWDHTNLPIMSKVPTAERLAKNGTDGVDMAVGGSDVKDGRVQFWQIGENPFSFAMLDKNARAKLEAKLPDSATMSMPAAPVKPDYPNFVPPATPTFEEKEPKDLWKSLVSGSGYSSKTAPTASPNLFLTANQKLSRAEKHILNWETAQEVSQSGYEYMVESKKRAQQMALSPDPLLAAAGKHYADEFSRIGVEFGGHVSALKPAASFPADQQKFKAFVPTAEILAAQAEAKKNQGAAAEAALKKAKADHEEAKKKIDEKFEEATQKHEAAVAQITALSASSSKLSAIKLNHWPVPKNVHRNAEEADAAIFDKGSTWKGDYGKSFDSGPHSSSTDQVNEMHSYQIDLTHLVSESGKTAKTKKLLVHYAPTQMNYGEKRAVAGRLGALRIQYPAGSTSAEIQDYTRRVYAHLGLDTRPATTEEHELSYLRNMAWLRKIEGYKSPDGLTIEDSEPAGPTSGKINFWIEQFKKPPTEAGGGYHAVTASWASAAGGLGHDPRFKPIMESGQPKKDAKGNVLYHVAADGKPEKNPFYQPVAIDYDGEGTTGFRRFDITDEEMDAYIKKGASLWKSSSSLAKKRKTFFNTGTMYSTERRNNMGGMPHGGDRVGTSPGSDVSTAGSNTIYFFLSPHSKPPGQSWLGISPKIMLYTPTFSHHSDSFGAKNDYESGRDSKARAGSVQETTISEAMEKAGGGAETLVHNKISFRKWITRFKAPDDETRQKWLDKLKAAGITTLGIENKPIEEVIVT